MAAVPRSRCARDGRRHGEHAGGACGRRLDRRPRARGTARHLPHAARHAGGVGGPRPRRRRCQQKPVGTGPWTLVEWRRGDYLEFARNASDFGGAPAIDTRIARIVPEPITAVAEFEAGTVDLLYLPEDQTRE
ncbi:MAG: ABC transporter substrate-binding protein [Gemmatimonas sp.]